MSGACREVSSDDSVLHERLATNPMLLLLIPAWSILSWHQAGVSYYCLTGCVHAVAAGRLGCPSFCKACSSQTRPWMSQARSVARCYIPLQGIVGSDLLNSAMKRAGIHKLALLPDLEASVGSMQRAGTIPRPDVLTHDGTQGLESRPVTIAHDGFGLCSFIYAAHLLQWVHNNEVWSQQRGSVALTPAGSPMYVHTDCTFSGPAAFSWVCGTEALERLRIFALLNFCIGSVIRDMLLAHIVRAQVMTQIISQDCGVYSPLNRSWNAIRKAGLAVNPFNTKEAAPLKAQIQHSGRMLPKTVIVELDVGMLRVSDEVISYFNDTPSCLGGTQGDHYDLIFRPDKWGYTCDLHLNNIHYMSGSHCYLVWALRKAIPLHNRGKPLTILWSWWKSPPSQDIGDILPDRGRAMPQFDDINSVAFGKHGNWKSKKAAPLHEDNCKASWCADLNEDLKKFESKAR